MYPAAKVLMTTRDAESWLKSAWDTILLYKKLTWGSPHLFDTWWGFGSVVVESCRVLVSSCTANPNSSTR